MFQRLKVKLNEYKYRSVPWLLLNWRKKGSLKKVTSIENHSIEKNNEYISILKNLFERLHNKSSQETLPCHVIKDALGFSIHKKKSFISSAGTGVFVKDGIVRKGSIVALYPGTVYYPSEPLFFQSLGNSFILQCVDGVMIDGKERGLSCKIFRSCAARDVIGTYRFCDTSWMTSQNLNPLAIGQYVNNANKEYPANVIYQELDITLSFPVHLLQFIPNINFNAPLLTREYGDEKDDILVIRTVLLIALRDINEGEEIFSSYFTEVKF